ncbi:S8 family serine peptidase [Catelliglobosispora koreensis]|uniref:S8 family serine peptidase n=1 Tax=Catelliglobosispora koreensis TaxID=129052 RepID=UPI000477C21F|nr:S8 family serine peptidase [Catelliglobosispora koreensis]
MKLQLPARRLVVGALAVAMGIAVTASAPGAIAANPGETSLYIVQTKSEPAAVHPTTKPAEGEKLNARSVGVRNLVSQLRGEHNRSLAAAKVDASRKVYDYSLTFNGYAARLTEAEAARLKASKDVVRVWKDEIVQADTTTTRDFLGLTGNSGVWKKQFHGDQNAGLGVIVGVIDSGIWPESASFAPLSEPRPDQAIINAKWNGVCDSGPENPFPCNNKLIGARSFQAGITRTPFEFNSARGYSGHGTHTASTAAGNFNVPASINGFDLGTTSGMAPAARIAVYKGLWATANPDGTPTGSSSGSTADLAAAIDAAVSDGVDVINYSISGSTSSIIRATDISFFNAAAAGVFISASAGNSGDLGPSQVNHNAPWMTTVAAGTHDRGNQKTVTLGNGTSYTGVGVVPPAVPSSPLVDSAAIPAAGFTSAQSTLCLLNSIDPAQAAGKIVICTRGTNDRVQKSLVVKNAGGVGMIHTNTTAAQSINGDWHIIPTVHFGPTEGAAIKAYAATAGATAAISVTDTNKVVAPLMAGFSSYGPAIAGGGDLLKPDITAPGVDVIASVAPPGHAGKNFDGLSGTSMAAPHIAGIAALLKSKNPNWSPMWIKSALMTSATDKNSAGNPIGTQAGGAASPLNYGSGHVVAGKAFDPGLVYDSTPQEWVQYGCALGQFQLVTAPGTCEAAGAIDPSNLNYPSIAVGDLAGKQTITRTVTNVTKRAGIYQVKVTAPAGFTAKASPEWLVILPGKKANYKVTLTRTTAAFGQFTFGSVTLDEVATGNHLVKSPIAVRPLAVAAPVETSGTGVSGSASLTVTPGYTGTLTASVAGLTASAASDLGFTAVNTNFNPAAPAVSDSVKKITVTVPAGTSVARFATYDDEAPADTDTDMYVYRGGTATLLAQSAGGTNEEIVTTTAAGTYDIYVVMFAHAGATIPPIKFHAFVVPPADAGNMTPVPASQSVTIATAATVTLNWSGLTAGSRYLGVVSYGDGTAAHASRTIVYVH